MFKRISKYSLSRFHKLIIYLVDLNAAINTVKQAKSLNEDTRSAKSSAQ